MEFLNKIFAKTVDQVSPNQGETFLKLKSNGEVVKATTVSWSELSDISAFGRTISGAVPAPGGTTTTRYLREDGTWVTPPDNDTIYTHPTKAWVDKTALTGAVVISNITVDSLGHPTNWITRSLTAANIGAEPAFTKNTGFNKNFGSTEGTVAEGNDSRIVNGQTAFGWGNHAGLYRPVSWVPTWNEVSGKPTTFTPSEHTLTSHSDVTITTPATNHYISWNGTAWVNTQVSYLELSNVPATFAPSAHNHDASNITTGTLGVARGGTGATTFISGNVLIGAGTGAVTTLSRSGIDTRATFPATAHTHAAADITSGILSYDRLPISSANVTNWNTAHGWGNHATANYAVMGSATANQTNYLMINRSANVPLYVNLVSGGGDIARFYLGGTVGAVSSASNQVTITNTGGVTATGVVAASGGNSTNWNTAFGWGNHASAGYVPNTRTITAGLHLSGGGTLADDRAITLTPQVGNWVMDSQSQNRMYFGNTSSTSSIILRSSSTNGQFQIRNAANASTFIVTAETGTLTGGIVPWTRLSNHITITAGDGLTGGGVLSASRTLNVDYGIVANTVAAGDHKYHQFGTNEERYDSYTQGRYLRLFTETANFDNFRFRPYSNVQRWNGSSWVTWAQSLDTLFDGREETGFLLQPADKKFRFEINRGSGWPTTSLFVLQSTWANISSPSCSVIIETWNGSSWVEKTSWTYSSFLTGINLRTVTQTHDGFTQMRVTIEADWTAVSHDYLPLRRIMFLSNYSGTAMNPMSWDYNRNTTFSGTITASGGNSTNWNTAFGWGNHASAGYSSGTGAAGQVTFWTGAGTQSGDSGLVWDNANKTLTSSKTFFGGSFSNFNQSALPSIYRTGGGVNYPFNAFGHLVIEGRGDGTSFRDIVFATSNTWRWSILTNGIFQSNGAQTIQTSSGNLTLQGNGGTLVTGGHIEATNNTAKVFSDINATNGSANAWNSSSSGLKLRNSNNALAIIVGGTSNNRIAGIQVGHDSVANASATGVLTLNALGGDVLIGASALLTGGGKLQVSGDVNVTHNLYAVLQLNRSNTPSVAISYTGNDNITTYAGATSGWFGVSSAVQNFNTSAPFRVQASTGNTVIGGTLNVSGTATVVGEIQSKRPSNSLSFGMFEGNTGTRTWGIYQTGAGHDFALRRYGGLGDDNIITINRTSNNWTFNTNILTLNATGNTIISPTGTGNVLVGTATALGGGGKLQVSGDIRATGLITGDGLGVSNNSNSTGRGISLYSGAVNGMPNYGFAFAGIATFGSHGAVTADWATYFTMNATANRGWIFKAGSGSGGNVASISTAGVATFAGDVIAFSTSDNRLKDYMVPIHNALDKISMLKGYNFVWNAKQTLYKPGTRDIGVSAQEIEKVFPELVDTRLNGYKAVKYDKLVAVLIQGINELQKEITELKSRI